MSIIRKISVGKEYPDGAMHYQVGKSVKLNGNYFEVSSIVERKVSEDKVEHNVYLKDSGVNVLWKTIVDMPIIVEYNIDFE